MEIANFKLSPIERNGQRVLMTMQLAEAYNTTRRVISNNFNRNKDRFKEGVHYFRLTGEALREFKRTYKLTGNQFDDSLSKIRELYLWTERGTLLHAKSLNTEKAWEVFEFLEDNYFHTRKIIESGSYLSVQVIEKLELMEQNQKRIEQKINALEKKVDSHADNIIKTLFDMAKDVIANGFETLHNKFSE